MPVPGRRGLPVRPTLRRVDPSFRRALPSEQVGEGCAEPVTIDGEPVLVRRLGDGSVVAFEPACPHQGQPLRTAVLTGATLECTRHFYAYDLRSGRNTFPGDERDEPLTVYRTVERDGWVWVGPPEPPS